MSPIRLALLSLARHRLATALSMIAIAFSVATGGLLLRLNELSMSRFSTLARTADAVVGAKAGGIDILLDSLGGEGGYPDYLPYKLFQSLRSEQTVRFEDGANSTPTFIHAVVPFLYFAKYGEARVVGTDEAFIDPRTSPLVPKISKGSWPKDKGEVALGSQIARRGGLEVGSKIDVRPWVTGTPLEETFQLKVTAILDESQTEWDRTLFSTVAQAQETLANHAALIQSKSIWGPEVLNYFLITLEPGGFQGLEALVNRRTVGQAIKVEDQIERLKELTGAGRNIGLMVTMFVIFLGGLSVCAMLVTRFEGMRLQIAVLRAIGYTSSELALSLLAEGVALGLAGVVIGAALDLTLMPFLRESLGSALPPPELVPVSIFTSAPIWLVGLLATVVSVFVPMWQMSRQDPHAALRGA